MFKITIEQEVDSVWNKVTLEDEVVQLEDLINMCERALLGIGFCFKGHLDLVIDDPTPVKTDMEQIEEWGEKFESLKHYSGEEVIKPVAKKSVAKKIKKPMKKGKC